MRIIAWVKRLGRKNVLDSKKRYFNHVEQLEPRLLLSGDMFSSVLPQTQSHEAAIEMSTTMTKTFTSPYEGAESYHYEKTFINFGIGNVWTKSGVAKTPGNITQITYADTIGAGIRAIKAFDGIQKNFTVGTTGNYSITFNGYTTGKVYVVTSKFIGNAKGGWQADVEGSIVEITSNGAARDIDYTKKTVNIYSSERSILELVDDINHVSAQIQKVKNLQDPGILSTFAHAFGDAVIPAKNWVNEKYSFTVSAHLEAGKTYAWQLLSVSEVDSSSALVATNGTGMAFRNQIESVVLTPKFQIERPIRGNHFIIEGTRWKDVNAFWSDNDGIMETGEKVRLEVRLRSNSNARDVYSVIESDDVGVSITENEIDFADFSSGETRWSEDQCKMKISSGGARQSAFSMRVFYKIGSKSYYQDLTFNKQFHQQGEFEPSFDVVSVSLDDSVEYDRKNNGDGVFQSGEQIHIRPTIKNIGTANATGDVEVILLPSNGKVRYVEQRLEYPDLLKGNSASPISGDKFEVDADVSFSGLHRFDLRIEWADGTRSVQIPNAFRLDVKPVAWARVKDSRADLGDLSKGKIASHPMVIFNDGSKPLEITGFTFTDENGKPVTDTTTDKTNVVILPGESKEVFIRIDTSRLDGVFSRRVTFLSDGRLRKPEHAVMTLSGFVKEDIPEDGLVENFESYTLNTWPESWIPDGNAKSSGNEVVTDPENANNKVLKLYGRVGSRWAAIAYHPYEFSEEYTMSLRIYNGDEVIPDYGHQGRGVVQMRHGTYWHGATNPAIRLIEFMKDGSVLAVDRSVIGQYETNQWYDLEIGFSRKADGIVVNYRLDGKSLGFVSIAVPDWIDEKPLDHVNLEASAGSAYFDDLHIRKGDFVAPEVSVDRLTTTDKTPALTGKVDDPDASVSVEVDGKTYQATNNRDGTWTLLGDTISPDLDEGVYDIAVSALDSAGSVGVDATTNELTIEAEPKIQVEHLITRRLSRSRFNRRTGRTSLEVTITNTSDKTIEGPVIVTVDESSVESISLVNKTGVTDDGLAYIDVTHQLNDGKLEPGESITVELDIENELRKRLRPLRIGARARRIR